MARRTVVKLVLGVLLAVGLVVLVLTALQRQLIYFPDPRAVPPASEVIDGARDVTLHTEDGLELGAWFVPARGEDSGFAVLLLPGNAGNREGRAGIAEALRRRGMAVLLLDYRGYGGNPGRPTEEGLTADAEAGADALVDLGYPPERTIYFGESIGSGPAAALASTRPPAGVVLRSPFPELADVGAHHYRLLPVRLLLRDRFPVVDHLAHSDVPVTVVRGDRDSVIPTELSARVAREVGNLSEEVVIRGADHNDPVMFGPRVADAVLRLVQRLAG